MPRGAMEGWGGLAPIRSRQRAGHGRAFGRLGPGRGGSRFGRGPRSLDVQWVPARGGPLRIGGFRGAVWLGGGVLVGRGSPHWGPTSVTRARGCLSGGVRLIGGLLRSRGLGGGLDDAGSGLGLEVGSPRGSNTSGLAAGSVQACRFLLESTNKNIRPLIPPVCSLCTSWSSWRIRSTLCYMLFTGRQVGDNNNKCVIVMRQVYCCCRAFRGIPD